MKAKYITISRKGHDYKVTRDLTPEEKKNTWRRKAKTVTETLTEVKAKIISPNLALFQYEKAKQYEESRYHVIHIPTGLVIADITYDLVADVKKTFEKSKWTFKKGSRNTLCLFEDGFKFEMTCLIRYEIKDRK